MGLSAQMISECTVFVRSAPCASARTAWYTAVRRWFTLVICAEYASGAGSWVQRRESQTDEPRVDEGKVERVAIAFAVGTLRGRRSDEALPQQIRVGYIRVQRCVHAG